MYLYDTGQDEMHGYQNAHWDAMQLASYKYRLSALMQIGLVLAQCAASWSRRQTGAADIPYISSDQWWAVSFFALVVHTSLH